MKTLLWLKSVFNFEFTGHIQILMYQYVHSLWLSLYTCIYMYLWCHSRHLSKSSLYLKIKKKNSYTHSNSVLDIKSSKYTCNSYFLLLIIEFTHDSIQWRTRTSFDISLGREKTQIRAAVCTSPVESTNFEIRDTPSAVKPTTKYPGENYNKISWWELQQNIQVRTTTTYSGETYRRFWPGSWFI